MKTGTVALSISGHVWQLVNILKFPSGPIIQNPSPGHTAQPANILDLTMTFHPRMYAKVSGVTVTAPLLTSVFDDMAIDCWSVQAKRGAHGTYVSMHPRLTIVLDGGHLSLATSSDGAPVSASLVFVPGGAQLWGEIQHPRPFRHVDIHVKNKALWEMLGARHLDIVPILGKAPEPVLDKAEKIIRLGNLFQQDQARALAGELLRYVLLDPARASGAAGISRTKAYIEEHIEAPLHIARLAEIAEMSPTRFKQKFRTETGSSVRQWVIACRIERAKSLIRDGQRLVDIAALTGFSDQAHLNRCFKAVTGHTPGKWLKDSR